MLNESQTAVCVASMLSGIQGPGRREERVIRELAASRLVRNVCSAVFQNGGRRQRRRRRRWRVERRRASEAAQVRRCLYEDRDRGTERVKAKRVVCAFFANVSSQPRATSILIVYNDVGVCTGTAALVRGIVKTEGERERERERDKEMLNGLFVFPCLSLSLFPPLSLALSHSRDAEHSAVLNTCAVSTQKARSATRKRRLGPLVSQAGFVVVVVVTSVCLLPPLHFQPTSLSASKNKPSSAE